jgi:hypothetical protein
MNTDDLLQWAKSVGAFIEIFGDGTAEVQMGPAFDRRIEGRTLPDAIKKARAYHARWAHLWEGQR